MSKAFAIPEVQQASVTQRILETPETSSMSVASLILRVIVALVTLTISVTPVIFVTLAVFVELVAPPDSVIQRISETLTISSMSMALATLRALMALVTLTISAILATSATLVASVVSKVQLDYKTLRI